MVEIITKDSICVSNETKCVQVLMNTRQLLEETHQQQLQYEGTNKEREREREFFKG